MSRWYPAFVFVVAVIALMPHALAGQATYIAVDMGETNAPYRDEINRPPKVVSPIQTDQIEHLPLTLKFAEKLRQGDWPLWDPSVGGGTPMATVYPWLLSPFNVVYLVLPGWYATTLDAALTILVGELLMYLLLRRLGTGRAAATIGGVAYAFTGTALVFVQRPIGAVWVLPGLLWAIHRAMDRPTVGRVLTVGAFVSWCWFEGFPSAFAYSAYTAVAWATWLAVRSIARRRPAEGWVRAMLGAFGRLAATGTGFLWGALISMITLWPFADEIQRRGLLENRPTDLNSHLPTFYIWGIFDFTVNGNPVDPLSAWGGLNSVESVTTVGSIVLAAAGLGLLPPLTRRLRLSPAGRDAWPFFALLPAVSALLVFIGTRVLGWTYLLPGIAHNPLSRSRFLIGLGMAVIAALHVDRLLEPSQESSRERLPRVASLLPLAAWVGIALAAGDDVVRAVRGAGKVPEFREGLVVGLGFVLVAAAVLWLGRRFRVAPAAIAATLAALVFAQVAYPLRNFTPESPIEDFYPKTAGHEALEDLGAGTYRFAATTLNYYPNSAELLDLYDLRGIALYGREMKRLLEAASPATFVRDPLKQIMVREEWQLASPVYDDLALRHFALSTEEMPFGEVVAVDDAWTGWEPASVVEIPITVPAGRELAGVSVPLRASHGCDRSDLSFVLLEGGREVGRASRPAPDAAGDWLPVGLVGRSLEGTTAMVRVTAVPSCELDVGVIDEATGPQPFRIATQLILDDPEDGVHLVSTEQSWIYERPSARPLVSIHSRWRSFDDQASLLEVLKQRPAEERDDAYLVGGASGDRGSGGTASVLDFAIDDDHVTAEVDASGRSIVVLAQSASEGWGVSVDGEPAHLESVDGALMGVFVDPGRHDVRFEYRPKSFFAGAAVSATAGAMAVAALVISRWRRRRRPAHLAG